MSDGKSNRIETLRARRAQIDARLSQLEARSRAEKRKEDTRRKILLGAILMQEMEARPETDAWARKLLAERLAKPRDRALFNLSPLSEPSAVDVIS